MCKKFDISPITAMVNIHKKSLSRTMATYFQSSRTLLESSARLTLNLYILDFQIDISTNKVNVQFRRLALKSPPLGPKWGRWVKKLS